MIKLGFDEYTDRCVASAWDCHLLAEIEKFVIFGHCQSNVLGTRLLEGPKFATICK